MTEPASPGAPQPAGIDHAPGLDAVFDLEVVEGRYAIESIEGEIPPFVRGTYYLNGPGLRRRGDRAVDHWLDGDGLVTALHFPGPSDEGIAGRPTATHRFVRSDKYVEEEAAGRFLHRTFGTAFPGDRLLHGMALASPVNVSVYPFADRLLAFGEQGLPWELDPITLETRGLHTFGGRLNALSPLAAHPHFPRDGGMVDFGISFSPRRPNLQIYRFARDGELESRSRFPLEHPISVHDFALGDRHAVIYLSPYVLDAEALSERGATLLEALDWRPELGTKLLVVDLATGRPRVEIPIETGYCLHGIQAADLPGDRFLLDVIELEQPIYDQYRLNALFTEPRSARPRRFLLDLEAGTVLETRSIDCDWLADFPTVDPRTPAPADEFWMLAIAKSAAPGRKFFDSLLHCDWRTGEPVGIYRAEPGRFLGGEPVVVPDLTESSTAASSNGAILCQEFDAETGRSAFLLFDFREVARGPVARLPLKRPIPFGFHAAFAPDWPPAAWG